MPKVNWDHLHCPPQTHNGQVNSAVGRECDVTLEVRDVRKGVDDLIAENDRLHAELNETRAELRQARSELTTAFLRENQARGEAAKLYEDSTTLADALSRMASRYSEELVRRRAVEAAIDDARRPQQPQHAGPQQACPCRPE